MKHDKYEVLEKSWGVEVKNVTDFDPVHIFECGQCFRWNRESNGSYTGVAKGMAVNVNYADGVLQLENTSLKDFFNIWFDYFDLGRDYSEIKNMVAKDDIMKEAVSFGSGIRLLRQDFHETVISFIISANNMIPRIKQIIADQLGIDEDQIVPEAAFIDDLGADSLDIVELIMALEEEFDMEIPDEDAEKIKTVQDAIDYIKNHSA